jgi:hypothetical protein
LSKCFWYYNHHHHRRITITIITIAIITIIPGPNAHTYAHNSWEASSGFRWKI